MHWPTTLEEPASKSGRCKADQCDAKKKMRQLGCRSGDFTWLFPRVIIPNFGSDSREKSTRKDNAETQRALRFAEERWRTAPAPRSVEKEPASESVRYKTYTVKAEALRKADSQKWLCHC
jgi:hypothetical protein